MPLPAEVASSDRLIGRSAAALGFDRLSSQSINTPILQPCFRLPIKIGAGKSPDRCAYAANPR
jgi:hypothetical protein